VAVFSPPDGKRKYASAPAPNATTIAEARTVNHTTAIFRQINKHNPYTHHDALEFPDGQVALLTDLFEGQEATVLQLPAQLGTAAEIKAQERVPHI
jgi:hypothetical protein